MYCLFCCSLHSSHLLRNLTYSHKPDLSHCVPPHGVLLNVLTRSTTVMQGSAYHVLVGSNCVTPHGVLVNFLTRSTTLTHVSACHVSVGSNCVTPHEVLVNFLTRPTTLAQSAARKTPSAVPTADDKTNKNVQFFSTIVGLNNYS